MNTKIKHILMAVLICLTFSYCTNVNKNDNLVVMETYDPNDSTMVIWEGIYSGILPIDDWDEFAAIWLYNDSTYLMMTAEQDSKGDVNVTEGFLTFNDEVLQISTNDTTYYYYITTESLIPLTAELSYNTPIIKEKYTMRKRGGITDTYWRLKELNGNNISMTGLSEDPYMMISSDSLNIYGSSGCNDFRVRCRIREKNNIELEKVVMTRRGCRNQQLENNIVNALSNTNTYDIVSDTLIFYNGNTPVALFVADYLQ